MRHDDDKRETFDEKYRRRAHELDEHDTVQFERIEDEDTEDSNEVPKEEFTRQNREETETNDTSNNFKPRKSGISPALAGLLAGILGALLILGAYHFFFSGNNTDDVVEKQSKNTEEVRKEIEQSNGDKVVTDTIVAVEKARPAVVSVLNLQQQTSFFGTEMSDELLEAGTGSGVIYKLDGDYAYIVTNHHVIDGASGIQINTADGESIEAELLGSDVWTDLAVLRVPKGNIEDVIEFGNSDELLVGEDAIAIGSPLGDMFSGSVSRGIVSALDRAVPVDIDGDGTIDWEATVLQTDAAINPGNSGGALVNSDGQLIGINSMKIGLDNVEGIGFAIPSNDVKSIIEELENGGEVDRPFIGVSLVDLFLVNDSDKVRYLKLPEDVTDGVVISEVQSGSPADRAGIEEFSVITQLDDTEVNSAMEFRQYLYGNKKPGDTITVTYYYDGQKETTDVQL